MSRRGRPAAREGRAVEGAADYASMFEAMMTSIMRRMPTPGPSVDVGVQVQAPKPVDFAKLCKDYTALRGKIFLGTESTIEVQRWIDACKRIFGDLGIEMQLRGSLHQDSFKEELLIGGILSPLIPQRKRSLGSNSKLDLRLSSFLQLRNLFCSRSLWNSSKVEDQFLSMFLSLKLCPSMLGHILNLPIRRMKSL